MDTVKQKKKREPLIHITKRDGMPFHKALLIRIIAVVAAFALIGILTLILTGLNPFGVYEKLFYGSFRTSGKMWKTLRDTALLLGIALAITPAFRMRFWNIGAEGQVLAGALGCAAVMIELGDAAIPNWLLILIMLVVSLLSGAICALLPAVFKVWLGTNETLFTLMMNYIMMKLISFCIVFFKWGKQAGAIEMNTINAKTQRGWLPELFNNEFVLPVLLFAIIAVLMYLYLRYSKQGYEISVVGESEKTARYVGIGVGRVVLRTMIISGALCGLVGFMFVSGIDYEVSPATAGGDGFTAIIVSWLAAFNPLIMLLTSFLMIFFRYGAKELATSYDVITADYADVLMGITIFFIIGCEFFIRYRIHLRHKQKEVETI